MQENLESSAISMDSIDYSVKKQHSHCKKGVDNEVMGMGQERIGAWLSLQAMQHTREAQQLEKEHSDHHQ